MTAPFTIAVIDDDKGFCDAMAWLFTAHGYDCLPFTSAREFLNKIDPLMIGCALMDLVLPGNDGISAMVAARRFGLDAPIILISGKGDIPTAVRAVSHGAFGFVEKPVNNQALLSMVEQACALHERQCAQYGRAAPVRERFTTVTAREREVFWALVDGCSSKEASLRLSISHRTVEQHRAQVMKKMGAQSLSDLVRAAHFLGDCKQTP